MDFISKFTKRDLGFAILTGLITGTIAWQILGFLNVIPLHFGPLVPINCQYPSFAPCFGYQYSLPWVYLIIIIPIVWILGVLLGYFLGQWLNFFNQFGKFAAIGFTNAAVDFGVLNILISLTGFFDGKGYVGIKSISFVVALLFSYIWNKYWAFRSDNNQGGATEFGKFFLVTIVSFAVNVSSASVVVNYTEPLGRIDPHVWANVGAIVGSVLGLVFSFVGFKLVVFKR